VLNLYPIPRKVRPKMKIVKKKSPLQTTLTESAQCRTQSAAAAHHSPFPCMALVKTEPTAYEGSYECAICWDSCRGDKDILGCVRCPGVRKMHVKCYEGWLAAGKQKGCTQCNGPISAYIPELVEACVLVIDSDEEPATMEPEKAKTAQRKAEEEAAKKLAQEEAKNAEAEGKEAMSAKRKAEEDAEKKKQAEEAKKKAEQVNKKKLEPETKTVKGEAEKATKQKVEAGAAKQKLAAQEAPAKKKAKMETMAKTNAVEDDEMWMKNDAKEAAAATKGAALRYGRSELRGNECFLVCSVLG
jgi:hypothetical protein